MSIARGLILLAAVATCAWFALGIRQARDTDRASGIVTSASSISAPAAAHVNSLLDAAGWLNPDRQVDVVRAELALQRNDPSAAERILRGLTHSEPMNVEAWVLLAQAAQGRDPAVFGLAIRNIGHLDPRIK